MSVAALRTMLLSSASLVAASIALHAVPAAASVEAQIMELAVADHRAPGHAARNRYRHPVETLSFFGLRDDMTVVEVSPGGGGWYTEILAPLLHDSGKLYCASYDSESTSDYAVRNAARFKAKLEERPELYGNVVVTEFAPPAKTALAPAGSADLVLTFRNVHGWLGNDAAPEAFAAFYKVLKPGGVLGLVQHRGDAKQPQDPEARSGYVREDVVIRLARAAGFRLDGSADINANPADDHDHPEGVWTLPPALQLGDKDREKYAAVGESDRMTLRFVKPR
ncbi:MAG: methyltransferase [Pseudomonadota bacterium]